MDWLALISMALLMFACVALGTWPLRHFLLLRKILDHPGARSSHTMPTPKGAGLVLIPAVLFSWITVSFLEFTDFPIVKIAAVSFAAIFLMLLSWLDDLHDLHFGIRLLAQTLMACVGLLGLTDNSLIFQGLLPQIIDQIVTVFLWVWFINLFNFMDGIDGISAVETILISGGVIAISIFFPSVSDYSPYAALLFGGACGFLVWNWNPARIFLGDAGSAPLGFLLGWLLLALAAEGFWIPALMLPGYYLIDTGITLIKRALRGEKIWQAHRHHFYQQAVQRGLSHGWVAFIVFISGLLLCFLAIMSATHDNDWLLIVGVLTGLAVIRYFSGRPVFSLHH